MVWLVLAFIGFFAGSIASLLGIGGGIILVPALLYITPLTSFSPPITPQLATGTSLILIIISALSGTIRYAKKGLIDYTAAWLFFIGAAPGAVLGALLNRGLNLESFSLFFGIFILVMFLTLLWRDKMKPLAINWPISKEYISPSGEIHKYGYSASVSIAIAILVGTMSSLFGIGGGALIVPIMLLLYNFPTHVATATSMSVILLSSTVGSLTHLVLNNIAWKLVITIAPGAWFGGKFGAKLSGQVKGKFIERLLLIVLLLIAIRMIGKGII